MMKMIKKENKDREKFLPKITFERQREKVVKSLLTGWRIYFTIVT